MTDGRPKALKADLPPEELLCTIITDHHLLTRSSSSSPSTTLLYLPKAAGICPNSHWFGTRRGLYHGG